MSAAEFFSTADFAVTARTGAGRLVNGLFDNDVRTILDIDSSGPAFTCATDAGIAAGETLAINGKNYRIAARAAGDTEVTIWALHEVK